MMTKNKMKKLLTFCFLISFLFSKSQNTNNENIEQLRNKVFEKHAKYKVYLNRKTTGGRVKIKNGSFINAIFKDSIKTGFGKILLITENGFFISPIQSNDDSIQVQIDSAKKVFYKWQTTSFDTVIFVDYKKISQLTYINHLKSKTNFALLNLTTGAILFIGTVVLGIADKDAHFMSEVLPVMTATLVPTLWGWYKYKKLIKVKSYKMTEWEFVLKKKLRQ